jgi:hypothetical protein
MQTPAAAPDDAITVRPFEAGDERHVLGLLHEGFGRWPNEIHSVTSSAFFDWKHRSSPFGPSTLYVAVADGAAVGVAAYMPWRLGANGRVIETMRGSDFAIHSSYRRKGASMALRAAPDFSADVAFRWGNPNEESRLGAIKIGQSEVSGIAHFLQPCRALRRTAQRARGRGAKTPEQLEVAAPAAGEALRDDTHAERLLAGVRAPGARLRTVKDLEYVRWRYGHFEEYRAIETDAGRGGIVIFRPRRHGPFWVTEVYELFVEENDHRAARRLFSQLRDATPADFISCSFSCRRQAARCGFVVPSRYRATLTVEPCIENLVPDPRRRDSWALSLGDLELL